MHKPQESTPEWLTDNLLQVALKSYKHDDTVKVLNFDVRSGFSEHFGSVMFQSKIEFKSSKHPKSEPETLNVVIKAEPAGDALNSKIVAGGPLFETEVRMYKETLPAIHLLLERSGLKVEVSPE